MSSRHHTPTLQMSQHSTTYPNYKCGYLHQFSFESRSSRMGIHILMLSLKFSDIQANIKHSACSSSSTFLTLSLASSAREFWIRFLRIYNLFSCLRTILKFRFQSKKFGPVNLLASSMLCRDMLLLILIHKPIYIR